MSDDFRVQVKVTNNHLWQAIKAAGYPNVNQFCVAEGFSAGNIGELLNMKASPLGKDGDWLPTVRRLSEILGPLPDELFPDSIPQLPCNVSEFTSSSEDIERLIEQIDARELVGKLKESAHLSPRLAGVLEARYGDDDETLVQVGERFGVSSCRIAENEAAALRKLRRASDRLDQK